MADENNLKLKEKLDDLCDFFVESDVIKPGYYASGDLGADNLKVYITRVIPKKKERYKELDCGLIIDMGEG